jgi:transposase-like protein
MDTETRMPETLLEAVKFFSDQDVSLAFVAKLRWPNGVTCPRCDAADPSFLSTRRIWKCRGCKKQFSVKVGTIFEDSPLGLDKWLPALWMVINCKNGISSYEMARDLGVTQKSAWFINHRIRLAVQEGTFEPMSGEAEVDETYIGGRARFMHKSCKEQKIGGATGKVGKTAVMGLLERHGEDGHSKVRAQVVPNVKRKTLGPKVRENVAAGSEVFTDALESYADLSDAYTHAVIDHAESYVNGKIHTNGLKTSGVSSSGPSREPMSAWSPSTCSATWTNSPFGSTPAR